MSTSRTAPRMTICGIPELGEHSAAGVTHVLSILGPNSPDPPEFAAFAPHRRLILRFHDVIEPQPDQIAPTRQDVERRAGRPFGMGLHQDQRCRRGRARHPGTAVHEQMSPRCFADLPALRNLLRYIGSNQLRLSARM